MSEWIIYFVYVFVRSMVKCQMLINLHSDPTTKICLFRTIARLDLISTRFKNVIGFFYESTIIQSSLTLGIRMFNYETALLFAEFDNLYYHYYYSRVVAITYSVDSLISNYYLLNIGVSCQSSRTDNTITLCSTIRL